MQGEGKTVVLIGSQSRLLGLIAVADQPKANALINQFDGIRGQAVFLPAQ